MDAIFKLIQFGGFVGQGLLQLLFVVVALVVVERYLLPGKFGSFTGGMWNRLGRVLRRPAYKDFSDRALAVMLRANEEAERFKYEYVGTEHVLLALLLESAGATPEVFKNLDVPRQDVRKKIEELAIRGSSGMTAETALSMLGKLPQTPRVERALAFAREEARKMGRQRIEAEHLLIGIARTEESVGAHILQEFGLEADLIRDEILKVRRGTRRK